MTDSIHGTHQGQPLLMAGQPLSSAKAALILLHGRGASAEDILELSVILSHPDYAYLAPQAGDNSWYPYSFLVPILQNEPGITSGLRVLADALATVESAGIPAERIVLGGFSQGACLASEFVARHARRYGGLLVLSGSLIGPPGTPRDYEGTLEGTPVFIGCSDVDPYIPIERVTETADVLTDLGAAVTKKIYPGAGHTILQDEIDHAMQIMRRVAS